MSSKAPGVEIAVELFASSHIGRVRKNNEDTFLVADLTRSRSGLSSDVRAHAVGELGTLLLVSDGMGGALAGEVASRMVVDHLQRELVAKRAEGQASARLLNAIERANLAIWHAGHSGPAHTSMGATITAAIIEGAKVYIAEVGDSRAYLIRSGVITQLTRDQSMVQRLVDEGVITAEQAVHHPNRNIILQSLGSQRSVNVEMSELALCRYDFLLICTDGLTNKVPDSEIKDIILGSMSVESACCNLVEAANRHGGDDNITVVLARFNGAALALPPEDLDTTDSGSVKSVMDELRRAATGEYSYRNHRTQEIFRHTQQMAMPANGAAKRTGDDQPPPTDFAPKFTDIEGARTPVIKIAAIIALLAIIILLLIKLR